MEMKSLLPVLAPVVKEVWSSVIHPELLKLEGEISNVAIKDIALALDPIISKMIEEELAKLAASVA